MITSGGSNAAADACKNAHIQNTGSFAGLKPDCRTGPAPPPITYADLQISAQKAACQLKLNLPSEGRTHVSDSTPVTYHTVPPTSGNHNPVPISDGAYLTPVTAITTFLPTDVR